jgi:hypothetical protein
VRGSLIAAALLAAALLAAALLVAAGCGSGDQPNAEPRESRLNRARVALGAGFVGGRASGLRALLDPNLIVQPAEPDSALRGGAAVAYLERLARETNVGQSELLPGRISEEGGFLLENGTWILESGRQYRSRYTIRWRDSPAGWRVVLWRWTRFR